MDTTDRTDDLEEILGDLRFPVEKWQITSCAEIYGADMRTRRALYNLPAREYENAEDILTALEA